MFSGMRSFPSDRLRPLDRDHAPLSLAGVLVRIGVFLIIAAGLAMTAQNLSGAPH